jgi:hypothetical protein
MSDKLARRFARLGTRIALVGVLAGFGVAVTAAPASAAAAIACPSGVTWTVVMRYRSFQRFQALQTTTLTVTPVFLVSDARFLDNSLDSPAVYTITSSVSQTYTVSASVGVNINVTSYLQTSVSTSITASRTTSVGVSVATTVPAHSRVYADYGVDAYYVTYTVRKWWAETYDNGQPSAGVNECFNKGDYPQSTYAPTNSEGWKLRAG